MGKRRPPPVPDRKLGRARPKRDYKKAILIVCEDAKSSPSYFEDLVQHLRLATTEVKVCGRECGSDPLSVVDYAIVERDRRARDAERSPAVVSFDEVYCVVDVDHHKTLAQAVDKARRDGALTMIISRPCFEFWVLLHFKYTTQPHDSFDSLSPGLRRHFPDYAKGQRSFAVLEARTGLAVKHAERVIAYHERAGSRDVAPNPSTRVHELVKALFRVEGKELPGTTQ